VFFRVHLWLNFFSVFSLWPKFFCVNQRDFQPAAWLRNQRQKNLVNPVILSKNSWCLWVLVVSLPALRSPQGEVGSAKRAGIHNQNPKKIKKFSPFLTPYFTSSYLL